MPTPVIMGSSENHCVICSITGAACGSIIGLNPILGGFITFAGIIGVISYT